MFSNKGHGRKDGKKDSKKSRRLIKESSDSNLDDSAIGSSDSEKEIEHQHKKWDCITLRLNFLPQNPYIKRDEAISLDQGGFSIMYKSIFGQYRNFKNAMQKLFSQQFITLHADGSKEPLNAYLYLKQHVNYGIPVKNGSRIRPELISY